MKNNKEKGRMGEVLAVKFLEDRNYIIISQNYRFKTVGEIDIIALKNSELHFIEVKARTFDGFGSPAEAVNRKKQNKIRFVASAYMLKSKLNVKAVHFDVIEVWLGSNNINFIEDAF